MDIQEIKERLRRGLDGVTPGPWRSDHGGIYGDPDQGGWSVIALTRWRSPVNGERLKSWNRDSAHVANCDPDTVAALLADHDALTAERDRLREEVERLQAENRQLHEGIAMMSAGSR